MVPMLTCGLVRSNFAFATGVLLWTVSFLLARRAGRALRTLSTARARAAHDGPHVPHRSGGLSASRLRDDLLRHVRGNLGVGVELHAVARPALRLRPQVADVAEHLRQRHESAYDAGAAALLHRLDDAAAGVQVADDVTHVLLGSGDLN